MIMSKKKQKPQQVDEQPTAQHKNYNWMMEDLMKEDWWVKKVRKTDPSKDTYRVTILPEIDAGTDEKNNSDKWEPTADDFERLADLFRNHR